MATKHKKIKTQQTTLIREKHEKHVPHTKVAVASSQERIPSWMIPTLLIVTAIAFIPTLGADFVNLDDSDYVTNNLLVKGGSLKQLLTTPVQGNHHPLTMLSLYLNYLISGDNAWSYHLFNVLLHVLNCFLVFRLAMLLSSKNSIIAFTTALLFGIHPMHVESVAWISERKDVLYGAFFLAGLISYVNYVDKSSRKQYMLTIGWLVLSLLSKPAAVIFPLALFCIDLLRRREMNTRLFVEKVPFFMLALIMGVITMLEQRTAGATGQETFSMVTKVLFGFYGIMMYLVKLLLPFNLSVFYPYPAINEALPVEYYIAPLVFIGLAVLFAVSLKRNRVVAFGLLFYLVNLLLVLQFLPVGSAVIAERYTYIPYIGLFFIIAWLINQYAGVLMSKALTLILPVGLILLILTWKQTAVWKSSAALWDHAIETHPSNKAYANRGLLYRTEKNYDKALESYNKALALSMIDYETYSNRGNVYFDLQKPELALKDYRKALSIKPDFHPALDNMGSQFAVIGQYDSSLKYLSEALRARPDYKSSYSNRALVYMQLNRNEEAINDWKRFLQYEPGAADVYTIIAGLYTALGRYSESLEAVNKAIALNPQAQFYLTRSYTYSAMKNTQAARQDALTAKGKGLKIPDAYARQLGIQ